jgi:glycosyltransferase involved in cell wall biosynthesis
MSSIKNGPIAVFFTHGVSLELWKKRGMFSREVKFYQALAEKTGEVWFFTYGRNDNNYVDQLGTRIRIFSKRLPIPDLLYGFFIPFYFWKQLKKIRLVRIHQMAGAIPALITRWILQKPLIARCGFEWFIFLKHQHASRLKQWIVNFWEKITYRSAKIVIMTTKKDANFIVNRYGISWEKIAVIPNYVDIDLFKPLNEKKQKGSICFVGRLEKQKNLFALIEGLKDTGVHLILYGEGSLKSELKKLAKQLEISVEFRGRIDNERLPEALNACELFILPSFYEGNPKVLLEAMACGLPVIGTRVEGIKSIIENGRNGMLCETDADSIRTAIQQLLNDPEKQTHLGKAARQIILETSSISRAVEAEIGLYQSV